jgi:hypothetical protein
VAVNLENQFLKLKERINGIDKFYWSGENEYTGPIQPAAIIDLFMPKARTKNQNLLVLAERVPLRYYYEGAYDPDKPYINTGLMLARLDENFELMDYDPTLRVLKGLTGLLCPFGTAEGMRDSSPGPGSVMESYINVLYRIRGGS